MNVTNVTADATRKSSTDEETEGVFDVSKIKGKLAKRPPKGVGAAKKEKVGKDKKTESKKPKKVQFSPLLTDLINAPHSITEW